MVYPRGLVTMHAYYQELCNLAESFFFPVLPLHFFEALLADSFFHVETVICQPDKPAGRKGELKAQSEAFGFEA